MTNSSDAAVQFLIKFINIFGIYVIPGTAGLSALLNFTCLIIFWLKKFDQKNKFKYFIMKCFYDFVGSAIVIYFLNNLCFLQCNIYDSLVNQIYGHYFLYYGTSAIFFCEGIYHYIVRCFSFNSNLNN